MSILPQLQPQARSGDTAQDAVARMWLLFAVSALGLSTLQAVFLVLARVPGVAGWLPEAAFFKALVLHVDLSILVWFGAFAALIWSGVARMGSTLAPWLGILGATLLLAAALLPGVQPLMNNYLPVLDSPLFLTGLALFALAISWPAARALPALWMAGADLSLRLAALAALLWAGALAMLPLVGVPAAQGATGAAYYERLFWGAGHVMQFVHALLLLLVWRYLAVQAGLERAGHARLLPWLIPGLLALAAVPLLPWVDGSRGLDHGRVFTLWMAVTGWLLVVPLALRYLWLLVRQWRNAEPWMAIVLLGSISLYLAGAIAGSFIRGDNLMVPAHYHGAIGAITLAYMGLTYCLIPGLGGQAVAASAARVQASLYAGGLLMLIGGLAYAGLLGLARKTPAPMHTGEWMHYFGLGLAVAGGGMALVGSFYFVYLALRGLLLRPQTLPLGASRD